MSRHSYLYFAVVPAGLAAFAILDVVTTNPARERLPTVPRPTEVAPVKASPSLRCLFSDFTHASVVVGFDFVVAFPKNASPRFAERAEAVRNDPAVNFDASHPPIWSYAIDDGTPTITSPAGETRIVLYGLKLGVSDSSWIEAGIRSNDFRNLDGKCLQAHFPQAVASDPTEN